MNEFLRQNYFLLTHSVEILAATVGLYSYNKYKSTAAKFFIYFLLYVVLIDLIGRYPKYLQTVDKFDLIEGTLIEMNYWWYTLFWSIGFPVFLFYFNSRIMETSMCTKISKYIGYLFVLLVLLYLLYDFMAIFTTANIFLSVLSGLFITILSSVYFLDILQTDRVLKFYKSLYFYINVCAFVWSLLVTPMVFYNIYFSTADWSFVFLKWQIYLFANMFMYLTFAFALIYCKPQDD